MPLIATKESCRDAMKSHERIKSSVATNLLPEWDRVNSFLLAAEKKLASKAAHDRQRIRRKDSVR